MFEINFFFSFFPQVGNGHNWCSPYKQWQAQHGNDPYAILELQVGENLELLGDKKQFPVQPQRTCSTLCMKLSIIVLAKSTFHFVLMMYNYSLHLFAYLQNVSNLSHERKR